MKTLIAILSIVSVMAYAKTEKIDWKVCAKELNEYCTTITEDHGKHECLEEAPKAKVSKACHDFNEKLEDNFKDKHDHNKGHK